MCTSTSSQPHASLTSPNRRCPLGMANFAQNFFLGLTHSNRAFSFTASNDLADSQIKREGAHHDWRFASAGKCPRQRGGRGMESARGDGTGAKAH